MSITDVDKENRVSPKKDKPFGSGKCDGNNKNRP